MSITAREVGRSLEITLGGAEDGMDDREREIAERDVRRIIVPPVSAQDGREIWSFYARILFTQTDESAEDEAVRMTRIAVGAVIPDDAKPLDELTESSSRAERKAAEQRAVAEERWAAIEDLRHDEAERVTQLALYWNAQGGGLDVVEAMLRDGHPKAQEILLVRNRLWNVYSRLRMLMQSQSSDAASETLARADSSGTNTQSGISEPDERDAFGVRRSA